MYNEFNNYVKIDEEQKNIWDSQLRALIKMIQEDSEKRKFSDKMVKLTRYYQQKYNFEVNSIKGHEYWNVEADAFKHAFGSARMYFDMNKLGSWVGGIFHELKNLENPSAEWNMDSWNNNKGREIANEIDKEYGKVFYKFSEQQQNDIIAQKVMKKMRSGDLITNPNDKRKYLDKKENLINKYRVPIKAVTGLATPIEGVDEHIFTPEEIGNMSNEEYIQNEAIIDDQLERGKITNKPPKIDYENYTNPKSSSSRVFTREDIENMSKKEYLENEVEIMAQLKIIGIPFKNEVPKDAMTFSKEKYAKDSSNADGKWVTINGNHVFFEN